MTLLIAWADVARHAATPSVTRQKIVGVNADLQRVEFAAGTASEGHTHEHEQFVQVVEGRGTLILRDGEKAFAAGSVFHFPAGTWHAATFETATVLIEVNLRA